MKRLLIIIALCASCVAIDPGERVRVTEPLPRHTQEKVAWFWIVIGTFVLFHFASQGRL